MAKYLKWSCYAVSVVILEVAQTSSVIWTRGYSFVQFESEKVELYLYSISFRDRDRLTMILGCWAGPASIFTTAIAREKSLSHFNNSRLYTDCTSPWKMSLLSLPIPSERTCLPCYPQTALCTVHLSIMLSHVLITCSSQSLTSRSRVKVRHPVFVLGIPDGVRWQVC